MELKEGVMLDSCLMQIFLFADDTVHSDSTYMQRRT